MFLLGLKTTGFQFPEVDAWKLDTFLIGDTDEKIDKKLSNKN